MLGDRYGNILDRLCRSKCNHGGLHTFKPDDEIEEEQSGKGMWSKHLNTELNRICDCDGI